MVPPKPTLSNSTKWQLITQKLHNVRLVRHGYGTRYVQYVFVFVMGTRRQRLQRS